MDSAAPRETPQQDRAAPRTEAGNGLVEWFHHGNPLLSGEVRARVLEIEREAAAAPALPDTYEIRRQLSKYIGDPRDVNSVLREFDGWLARLTPPGDRDPNTPQLGFSAMASWFWGDRDRREAALAKELQLVGEWIGGPLADWIEQTPGTETMPPPPVTVLDFMAAPGQAGPPDEAAEIAALTLSDPAVAAFRRGLHRDQRGSDMARWIARPIFPEHPHVATAASSNHCVYLWQGQRCGESLPPVIMFPGEPSAAP